MISLINAKEGKYQQPIKQEQNSKGAVLILILSYNLGISGKHGEFKEYKRSRSFVWMSSMGLDERENFLIKKEWCNIVTA